MSCHASSQYVLGEGHGDILKGFRRSCCWHSAKDWILGMVGGVSSTADDKSNGNLFVSAPV